MTFVSLVGTTFAMTSEQYMVGAGPDVGRPMREEVPFDGGAIFDATTRWN